MLTETDLRELLNYSSTEPVLSLYLNTEPSSGNADAYRLRLRNMLKEITLPGDVDRIEQYFAHEYDWSGKSVAVFSCASEDYFRAYPLAIPVRSRIRVSKNPHFKPLADLWDAFGGYGVVLVDKQGARLFHFSLGVLEEQEGVVGEEIKHIKRGGASSVPGRRGGSSGSAGYEEELVDRNMKVAADFASHFFDVNHIRRVVIGGTEENVKTFKGLLPKTWQSLVVGSLAIPMTATIPEVHHKAMQIGRDAEALREARLIDTAITAEAKGTGGTVGLESTLAAVSGHRIQTLLLTDGYFSQGVKCPTCGFVSCQEVATCPQCAAPTEAVLDVVDLAVRSVLQAGGDVDIVHDNAALEKAGKIAAILRY